MSTLTAHLGRGAARRTLLALAALSVAALQLSLPVSSPTTLDPEQYEGRAPSRQELEPAVQAAFPDQSYRPGAATRLAFFNSAPGVTVQILRSGPEGQPTRTHDVMHGVPVTRPLRIGAVNTGRAFTSHLGNWPSGLYFARLQASDGRLGFAPFVLRPRRIGEHTVAVVLPTFTWQAYNIRDDNGDGKGDSWYADWKKKDVRLDRPFLSRGVPYNFRGYDLPFLHWLSWYHHDVDFLSDADLDRVANGDSLRRAYHLVIFPGHHEYVTAHEYDVTERYRDLGGHLMFLSANNFFRRVDVHGSRMHLVGIWRELGRPEAALIGVQYLANDSGEHRGPWIVRHSEALPWLFDGSGLGDGMTFASGGIEIDRTAAASPHSVKVLAEIPNLFGRGYTAQMTYYETPRGGAVFAAGAFTLAGSVLQPNVRALIENLFQRLS
jgi:N,N-dimethylformamidase beta subunit-like, C-terminal